VGAIAQAGYAVWVFAELAIVALSGSDGGFEGAEMGTDNLPYHIVMVHGLVCVCWCFLRGSRGW